MRLNIAKKCIEKERESELISSSGDDTDLMTPTFSSNIEESLPSSLSVAAFSQVSNFENSSVNQDQTLTMLSQTGITSIPENARNTLSEVVPFASDEEIDNALMMFGSIDTAANALVESGPISSADKVPKEGSSPQSILNIIANLGKQMQGIKKKIQIDPEDIINDAVAYYKSPTFDPCRSLRVTYTSQPAIDSGGVLRQFYSDVFEELAAGKPIELFEGEFTRKVPSYRPHAVMSGLLEMVGKIIAHSIAQGGPGFPYLAKPCYYYLVTGDALCAMAYCDVWDIPDIQNRNIVHQVC